jgi:hypothetical protein
MSEGADMHVDASPTAGSGHPNHAETPSTSENSPAKDRMGKNGHGKSGNLQESTSVSL